MIDYDIEEVNKLSWSFIMGINVVLSRSDDGNSFRVTEGFVYICLSEGNTTQFFSIPMTSMTLTTEHDE